MHLVSVVYQARLIHTRFVKLKLHPHTPPQHLSSLRRLRQVLLAEQHGQHHHLHPWYLRGARLWDLCLGHAGSVQETLYCQTCRLLAGSQ